MEAVAEGKQGGWKLEQMSSFFLEAVLSVVLSLVDTCLQALWEDPSMKYFV